MNGGQSQADVPYYGDDRDDKDQNDGTGLSWAEPLPQPAPASQPQVFNRSQPVASDSGFHTKPVATGSDQFNDQSRQEQTASTDQTKRHKKYSGFVHRPAESKLPDRSQPAPADLKEEAQPVATKLPTSTDQVAVQKDTEHRQEHILADDKTKPKQPTSTSRSASSKPTKGEEVVSVLEASKYLRKLGFDDMIPHNVQRYCRGIRRKGQLTCYWHDADGQYNISKVSLEKFAERLANETKEARVAEPDPAEQDQSPNQSSADDIGETQQVGTHPVGHSDDIQNHPIVKRLERQLSQVREDYKEARKDYKTQVAKTEKIQRVHAKELASLHQQALISLSQRYADTYLRLAGNRPPLPIPDFEEIDDPELDDISAEDHEVEPNS